MTNRQLWSGFPFAVQWPRRWRRVITLCTVLVAFAGPWIYAVGQKGDDPALLGVPVMMVWLLILGAAKGGAAALIAHDAELYHRAARTADRLFLRGILPAVALVVAAALVAGSELSLAALSYLGFPGVLLVTRLIELVALWIAPDGRPQLSAQTSEAAGAGAPHRSR